MPEEEARALARFVLLGLHGKPSSARLNARLVRQRILDIGVELFEPRLVMVPFVEEGDDLVVPGTDRRLPLLLLRGGAQLEALRETVHKLQARHQP